jgi:integrase
LCFAIAQSSWQAPDRERLKGKRDRALLSVLLACGLRRHEVAELAVDHLQQREGHWAIVNLSGKGGHVRTVPVPDWVYCELSTWMEAAGIKSGRVFRRVSSAGKSWGDGVTEKLAWHVVKEFATKTGVARLARALIYVGRLEVNWSRFSFYSRMCRSKRLSATSAARNVSLPPSTTRSESSRHRELIGPMDG